MNRYDARISRTACVPLPTEEFGFTSSICADVSVSSTEQSAKIYVKIDGVGEVDLGEIDNSTTEFSVDLGVTFSLLGKKGFGGTMQIIENKPSGCISACANVDYGIGSVAPWYTLITCLKPTMN